MKRYGRRVGWSIAALAIAGALGVAWVKWGGPLKRQLVEWTRSDASRLAEAARAYDRREWEKAVELTRPLLKSNPNDAESLKIYARASARMERDGVAVALYQNRLGASQLEPEDLFLLGLMNARVGKLESALEVWEKAAQQGPDNPELLDNLARLWRQCSAWTRRP
jgi:tetratricopeptide (TPR) repeat protein